MTETEPTSAVRWVDNHCHLGEDAQATIAGAQEAGVVHLIDVGCDLASSQEALAHARAHPAVSATAGVHPHEAAGGTAGIEALLDETEILAVGECGLDYYYDHSPRPTQRDVFAEQIGFANARSLPLVIHTRDAWDETFEILDREGVPERTVFHCFTGGPDEAAEGLRRGALLSFSGIVTFKSAKDLQQAAIDCPLDRLMVETDSPYLAPVPHRGRPNRPEHVVHVGAKIAELKEVAIAEVARASTRNATAFYALPLS